MTTTQWTYHYDILIQQKRFSITNYSWKNMPNFHTTKIQCLHVRPFRQRLQRQCRYQKCRSIIQSQSIISLGWLGFFFETKKDFTKLNWKKNKIKKRNPLIQHLDFWLTSELIHFGFNHPLFFGLAVPGSIPGPTCPPQKIMRNLSARICENQQKIANVIWFLCVKFNGSSGCYHHFDLFWSGEFARLSRPRWLPMPAQVRLKANGWGWKRLNFLGQWGLAWNIHIVGEKTKRLDGLETKDLNQI